MKRIEFSKLQIKEDMDKVVVLHYGHLVFLFMGLFIELTSTGRVGWTILKIIICAFLARLFYRTLKNLYYTFWSFGIFFILFYLISFLGTFSRPDSFSQMNCYLFALILLLIEMYLLHSPIFYPIVRWWEYDFRYRHDLKAVITIGEKSHPGRLTDLRRNAGCIQAFENFKVGDEVKIEIDTENETKKNIHGEIISKRQYSIGRPWNYGIKMTFSNPDEQKEFKELEFSWRQERKDKVLKKFETSIDHE